MAVQVVKNLMAQPVRVTLNVVGPIEDDYAGEVAAFIAANGLQERVHMHGLVSEAALNALYRSADVLLLTSLEESSPICVVEAMACGKPVIATDVGGVSHMVHSGQNGFLVKPEDETRMTEFVNAIVKDRDLRQRLGRVGRDMALRGWSSEAVALQTYDAYREILHG
jgi:glycosyltransferase involved in cell wall biosynthesis